MFISSTSVKTHFISLAYQEGILSLSGNSYKAGPSIEKYLEVFRETFAQKDPKYLDTNKGYDWCGAYVYYLLRQIGFKFNIKPLTYSDWTLGTVKTWYLWDLEENTFYILHSKT